MSGPDDSDDLDAQFDALIGENFPGAQTRRRQREFDVPLAPPPSLRPRRREDREEADEVRRPVRREQDDDEPLTVLDAMDRADAEDDEGWTPPATREVGPLPSAIILAILLVLLGLVVGVLGLMLPVPSLLRLVGGVGAVAGLALLLAHALRRQGPPPGDDDGAVV